METKIFTSPVGGWNDRESEILMPPEDATSFQNAISTGGHVEIRKGFKLFCETPSNNPVDSLFVYNDGSTKKLFFSQEVDGVPGIYEVKENTEPEQDAGWHAERVPDPAGYQMKGTKWCAFTFMNRVFLSSLDQKDKALMYSGTTLSVANFTSFSEYYELNPYMSQKFASYKNRLFFTEVGSTVIWYTVTSGVFFGQCGIIDVSSFLTKGGSVVAITEWARSGSDLMQSLFVVASSEGEILVFSGADPGGIRDDDWQLVSRCQIPEIVGQLNFISYKDDVVFTTKGGFYSLNSIINSPLADRRQAISDKIRGIIRRLTQVFGRDYWQIFYAIETNWIIVNIPINGLRVRQFVLNLENDTWSEFTGIPSSCWVDFNNETYFGGIAGNIYQFNKGGKDDTQPIKFYVQSAYSDYQVPNEKKIVGVTIFVASAFYKLAKLKAFADFKWQSDASFEIIGARGDLKISKWGSRPKTPTGGSLWNTIYWGTNRTLETMDAQKIKTDVNSVQGNWISFGIQLDSNEELESDTAWFSTAVRFEVSTR